MWREWFSAKEIVAARSDDLPTTIQGLNKLSARAGWRRDRERAKQAGGRGRPCWEYHISLLPFAAQIRLILTYGDPSETEAGPLPQWKQNVALRIDEIRRCWNALDPAERNEFIVQIIAGRAR